MDFIGDFNNTSAVDVIAFVKEVVEKFPKLRQSIVEKLMSTLGEVRAGKVYRGALWIVGEYCVEEQGMSSILVNDDKKCSKFYRYQGSMETDQS